MTPVYPGLMGARSGLSIFSAGVIGMWAQGVKPKSSGRVASDFLATFLASVLWLFLT